MVAVVVDDDEDYYHHHCKRCRRLLRYLAMVTVHDLLALVVTVEILESIRLVTTAEREEISPVVEVQTEI